MKRVYRVVFKNTYSTMSSTTKIVVTSNIEKSIARLRKIYEGETATYSVAQPAVFVTLVSVELIGKATLHA